MLPLGMPKVSNPSGFVSASGRSRAAAVPLWPVEHRENCVQLQPYLLESRTIDRHRVRLRPADGAGRADGSWCRFREKAVEILLQFDDTCAQVVGSDEWHGWLKQLGRSGTRRCLPPGDDARRRRLVAQFGQQSLRLG